MCNSDELRKNIQAYGNKKDQSSNSETGLTISSCAKYYLRVLMKFTIAQLSSASGNFFLKLGMSSRPSLIL